MDRYRPLFDWPDFSLPSFGQPPWGQMELPRLTAGVTDWLGQTFPSTAALPWEPPAPLPLSPDTPQLSPPMGVQAASPPSLLRQRLLPRQRQAGTRPVGEMQPFTPGQGGGLEAAIDEATDDPKLRQVMRMAALLEGGNLEGGWGVGDGGLSFGPYQIYTKVHNVTRQQAEDPRFAVQYMLPEFRRAMAEHGANWDADPMGTAAEVIYRAERPAKRYDPTRVQAAWQRLQGQPSAPKMAAASQAFKMGALTPDQFNSQLPTADALSACGPAAAVAFARATGRNPTLAEAVELAKQVGWNQQQGMAGPQSQVALMRRMGINAQLQGGVDWQRVAAEVQAGRPVILDTPQHYLVVEGFDANTGLFDLGQSALALRASGGRRWFRPEELARLGTGAIRSSIYLLG